MPTIMELMPKGARLLTAALLAAAALLCTPLRSEAQLVVVIVNGDPITAVDIEQRSKLMQLSNHKVPARQEVLDELIDEKLKIQLIRKYSIEGIDKDVDNAFANMARRMRATPAQFTEMLAKSGVMTGTLKSRIRAEITWSQVIRGRFASSLQFSDKDILEKAETRKDGDKDAVGYDYTLRPILFVVPRGSQPTVVEGRRKEADGLRARFQSCDEGIALARGLRDVAVRGAVVKSSADLAPELRQILEKTEVGKLTPPEVTLQGVEVYAVCAKKQSASDNAPTKKEAREELFTEQFQILAKRYLKELRSQAMIEYPK